MRYDSNYCSAAINLDFSNYVFGHDHPETINTIAHEIIAQIPKRPTTIILNSNILYCNDDQIVSIVQLLESIPYPASVKDIKYDMRYASCNNLVSHKMLNFLMEIFSKFRNVQSLYYVIPAYEDEDAVETRLEGLIQALPKHYTSLICPYPAQVCDNQLSTNLATLLSNKV